MIFSGHNGDPLYLVRPFLVFTPLFTYAFFSFSSPVLSVPQARVLEKWDGVVQGL